MTTSIVRRQAFVRDFCCFWGWLERSPCDARRAARFGGAEAVSRNKRPAEGELLRTRIFLFTAVLEPETIAVHLQNVDMMGQPIQERTGEPFRSYRQCVNCAHVSRHGAYNWGDLPIFYIARQVTLTPVFETTSPGRESVFGFFFCGVAHNQLPSLQA